MDAMIWDIFFMHFIFLFFLVKFVEFVDIDIVLPFSETFLAPEKWCLNNMKSWSFSVNLVCELFQGHRLPKLPDSSGRKFSENIETAL